MKKLISVGLACFMFISVAFPIQAFASTNGFVSDTTKDFTIPRDNSYTLRITSDNKNSNVSVTTGDSNIMRVINTIKNNNNYYITIKTAGKPNSSTGLYVNCNSKTTKLCNITVGYAVNNTGKHLDQIIDKNGKVTEVLNQDKGWQLQIEEKPIHYQVTESYDNKLHDQDITMEAYLSSVNQQEKYFIVSYGGHFSNFKDSGLKLTNASGTELKYDCSESCKFKVTYNDINDVKNMYFGTDTEKAKLTMIYFK